MILTVFYQIKSISDALLKMLAKFKLKTLTQDYY